MSVINNSVNMGLQEELALYLLGMESVDPSESEVGYDFGVDGNTSEYLLNSIGEAPQLGDSDQNVIGVFTPDVDLEMQAQLHAGMVVLQAQEHMIPIQG